eukprot:351973-Chlamydomonas_euryale.AAC.6
MQACVRACVRACVTTGTACDLNTLHLLDRASSHVHGCGTGHQAMCVSSGHEHIPLSRPPFPSVIIPAP